MGARVSALAGGNLYTLPYASLHYWVAGCTNLN